MHDMSNVLGSRVNVIGERGLYEHFTSTRICTLIVIKIVK
jgi:hypothetical protein